MLAGSESRIPSECIASMDKTAKASAKQQELPVVLVFEFIGHERRIVRPDRRNRTINTETVLSLLDTLVGSFEASEMNRGLDWTNVSLPGMAIPDHLPTIDRGWHSPYENVINVLEAACWLAGELWTNRPRSVHPVIARVAHLTNDCLGFQDRQLLWPLVLASIGTVHSWRPRLDWRLRWLARKSDSLSGRELRELWKTLVKVHDQMIQHS